MFKKLFQKNTNKLMTQTVPEFARQHKDLLIIVCDPRTDNVFAGYKGFMVSAKIKTADGKQHHYMREMLKHSQFDKNIDPFLVGVMEVLKLPLRAGSIFYNFLDGALFNISKSLRKKHDRPQPGAVPSPFVEKGQSNIKS